MRIAKKVARFITELILAVAIISFIIVNLSMETILNKSYILASLEKSNYYEQIYELLEQNFENYIQQSGLEKEVLKDIVTKEKIEEDSKKIIVNIYDDFYEEISTKEIEDNLEKNIKNQIKGRSLNASEKQAIDDFINKICEEYKATISNLEYERQINTVYRQIMKYIKIVKKGLVIIIGLAIIILVLLNLKRPYRIGVNTGTAMIASGMILVLMNIYTKIKLDIMHISILNAPISEVIRNIANDIISNILQYGAILTIVGLVLIILANLVHNIIKYNETSQEDEE